MRYRGYTIKCYANLHGATLRNVNLHGANLHNANLRNADLHGATLRGANLSDANLHGANLRNADLRDVNLHGANLYGATLHGANLRGANLRGANLRNADLRGANLSDARLPALSILPDEGDVIGWKKTADGSIVKLLIRCGTPRLNGTSRKCRAKSAEVLEISGQKKFALSGYDPSFVYEVGQKVKASNWDPDWRLTCAGGIHFFITRKEAEEY